MDWLHITLIVGLVLAIAAAIAASYAAFNLSKKIEVYEDWLVRFRTEAESLYVRLKEVDHRNLFDRDDDVGFVFSEILRIVKEFDETVK
jgi:hypothetical protein